MTGRTRRKAKANVAWAACARYPEETGQYELDEVGAAMWDADPTSTPLEKTY